MIFGFHKKSSVGNVGEDESVRFLKRNGYEILERNWFNKKGKRLGEIDIIAQTSDRMIVFVEVKTRTLFLNRDDMRPEEQITQSKMIKLQRVAECYIKEKGLWDRPWRFDAIAVLIKEGSVNNVRHLKNIYF